MDAVREPPEILGAAKRPLIVVGAGALDAGAGVLAVAELLEAPVSSFRRGRGLIPTSHRPWCPSPKETGSGRTWTRRCRRHTALLTAEQLGMDDVSQIYDSDDNPVELEIKVMKGDA